MPCPSRRELKFMATLATEFSSTQYHHTNSAVHGSRRRDMTVGGQDLEARSSNQRRHLDGRFTATFGQVAG